MKEPFEHLPVAAVIVDRRGRVLAANAEARRLAGKAARGQTCRAFWNCRERRSLCPLRKAFGSGRTVRRAKIPRGPPGGSAIERVGVFDRGRKAVILTGPSTAFFARQRALQRHARLDALTHLLNRGAFDELAEHGLRRERRRGLSAFIMADIDGLKSVNDLYGHRAGDALIGRMGALLRACARREDVVGRVGGDEFAVYFERTTLSEARAFVRRLKQALAADNARHPGEPALSAQFGLACARGRRRALLREAADRDLLERKLAREGREAGRTVAMRPLRRRDG